VKEREILMDYEIIDAPEYLERLIIYEIATKSFTSPNGPESGTFASMEEKLPYLEELGINAVWLTGHPLCDKVIFIISGQNMRVSVRTASTRVWGQRRSSGIS